MTRPGPASWTASAPSRRPTGTSRRRRSGCARRGSAPPPRRRAASPARASSPATFITAARLGVLLELNCETDFVARTDDFQQLARELAMQVAGLEPGLRRARGRARRGRRGAARDVARDAEAEGRPADRIAKIVDGKLNKWYAEHCLLELPYRDTDKKIGDLVTEKIALLGENIRVARFSRHGGRRRRCRRPSEAAEARPRSPEPHGDRARRRRATPGAAEALRRGADGRRGPTASIPTWSARSPGRSATAQREGVQIALVVGGGNIFRGLAASESGHGSRHRRLHGHARHRDERPGAAGRAGAGGHADPRAVRHRDERDLPSRTSAAARSGTSRRAASSSWWPGPAIRTSRPTRRRPCARSRSAPR